MAGYSWQRFYKDGGTRTTLMPDKEQWFVSSYTDHLQLISFFGRVNYAYKDTYLFTVTLRGDATSRFSKDNRWGAFPAGDFASTYLENYQRAFYGAGDFVYERIEVEVGLWYYGTAGH